MKKSLKVLSIAMLLMGVVSCNGGNNSTPSETPSSSIAQSSNSDKPSSSSVVTSSPSSSQVASSSSKPVSSSETPVSSSSSEAPISSSSSEAPISSSSSEAPISSSSSEEPISSSSSEDEKDVIVTKFLAGDFATVDISKGYKFNSAFTAMPNTVMDGSTKNITVDGVTMASGGRFKLNGAGSITAKSCKITSQAAGSVFRFVAQGANGTDTTRKWSIADATGNVLFTSENGVSPTGPEMGTYTLGEAGDYYFYATNGINVYYMDLTETVVKGEEVGFTIDYKNAKTDYFVDEDISLTGLTVTANFSSGATVNLAEDEYSVLSTAFDNTKAGVYPISVNYKGYPTQSFNVTVHSLDSLEVYSDFIMASASSKDIYRLPKVYKVGDTITTDNKIVSYGVSSDGFKGKINYVTFEVPSLSVEGVANINCNVVTAHNNVTTPIEVTAIDATKLVLDENGVANVAVNPSVTQEGNIVSDVMTFSTIQKAHDFLKTATVDATKKVINVPNGTYDEKLYIEIPNLTIKGGETTVIQYDAYADTKDCNGTSLSTYGSSSVSIKSTATNFAADSVTFKNNAFTSMEDYLAHSGNLQACAIVVDTNARFVSCRFEGYQDTLYARLGNQLYENCYITGMTDYIFGEDANALLSGCTIVSRNRQSTTNGGYICVTKPSATPTIGFVLDDCNISGEEGVVEGTVSLARPWGAKAKISYGNSQMTNVISKKAYGDTSTSNNPRFDQMSGNTPDKADFSEYNNRGDGSITEAVKGGKILTEAEYTALLTAAQNLFA